MKSQLSKKIALLLMGVSAPLSLFAEGSIKGTIVNGASNEPMDFVTIQLVDAKTQKPLQYATQSDENGAFLLTGIPNGEYVVRFTMSGSIPQERDIVVADNAIEIGQISLSDDAKLLQEVTVEGIKSQVRFDLDKRVFNVDQSILSAGQSASELLESIPSVEVDQDGEVSLRGNSSVTVWINGKESGLTADNRAQILEQIPGESIEKIEVITNPSAKYSPEGTAGIINIVLKQDRRGGYFGSAEVGATSRGGANAGFNINYSDSKWDLFGGIGFRYRRNKGGSWSRRTYEDFNDSGLDYMQNSDGTSKNIGRNIFLRMGATYHLTRKDQIYFNGFGMFGRNSNTSTTNYISDLPDHWLTNLNYSKSKRKMHGTHLELGYDHKWSDDHTISASFGYNSWGGPNDNLYEQMQGFENDVHETVIQDQKQDIKTSSLEAKVDYSIRFSEYLKLEAGYNGQYSHENSPVTTWNSTDRIPENLQKDLYNRFIYDNDITAFYVTLGGRTGNFSYSGGVRAETWQTRTRSLEYGQERDEVPLFKKNKFSLFPSLFLSYSLPYDNEIQINYTRRIRRPWGGQLNSFKDISNPTSISYGNPELQPEYTNAFELNYIKSFTFHMISISGYLRTSDDIMNRLSYLDSKGVMYSTWGNVSQRLNTGVELVVKNQLFNRVLELTTTGNVYHSRLKAWSTDFVQDGVTYNIHGDKQSNVAWDIRCMASVRLPWGLSFQATGRYNSRRLDAMSTHEPSWNVDCGLRKSLGNWSFMVNVRDLFDSRKMDHVTTGLNYREHAKRWRGGRTVRFTIKYSFGNMKAKRDKKENQDMMQMENNYNGEEM